MIKQAAICQSHHLGTCKKNVDSNPETCRRSFLALDHMRFGQDVLVCLWSVWGRGTSSKCPATGLAKADPRTEGTQPAPMPCGCGFFFLELDPGPNMDRNGFPVPQKIPKQSFGANPSPPKFRITKQKVIATPTKKCWCSVGNDSGCSE